MFSRPAGTTQNNQLYPPADLQCPAVCSHNTLSTFISSEFNSSLLSVQQSCSHNTLCTFIFSVFSSSAVIIHYIHSSPFTSYVGVGVFSSSAVIIHYIHSSPFTSCLGVGVFISIHQLSSVGVFSTENRQDGGRFQCKDTTEDVQNNDQVQKVDDNNYAVNGQDDGCFQCKFPTEDVEDNDHV